MASNTLGKKWRWVACGALLLSVGAGAILFSGCGTSQAAAGTTAQQGAQQGVDVQLVDTVTVNGNGRHSGTPDEAVVTLGVQNEAPDAAQALAANSEVMAAVLGAVKALGITETAITTSNVNLYPAVTYDPQTGEQKTQGYRAENLATVRLTDTALVAKVLEAGTAAGATTVYGPQWRLSDDTEVASQALVKGLTSARAKAEALATAAGAKLGEVVLISEGYTTSPILYETRATAAYGADSQQAAVSPGQVEVEVVVTATYRLVR